MSGMPASPTLADLRLAYAAHTIDGGTVTDAEITWLMLQVYGAPLLQHVKDWVASTNDIPSVEHMRRRWVERWTDLLETAAVGIANADNEEAALNQMCIMDCAMDRIEQVDTSVHRDFRRNSALLKGIQQKLLDYGIEVS